MQTIRSSLTRRDLTPTTRMALLPVPVALVVASLVLLGLGPENPRDLGTIGFVVVALLSPGLLSLPLMVRDNLLYVAGLFLLVLPLPAVTLMIRAGSGDAQDGIYLLAVPLLSMAVAFVAGWLDSRIDRPATDSGQRSPRMT